MSDDVFSEETKVVEAAPGETKPPVETLAVSGEDLVAKRLKDKDDYIEQLKSETAEMRATLAKQDNAAQELDTLREELLRLKEQSKLSTQARGNTSSALSETDIENLVAKALTKQEATRTATENIREANRLVVEAYGSEEAARAALDAKSAETKLSVNDLKEIAARSPSAFLSIVGATSSPASKVTNFDHKSTVNTAALSQLSGGAIKPGSKAYFDNLRKELGNSKFFTPDIQNQVFEAKRKGLY